MLSNKNWYIKVELVTLNFYVNPLMGVTPKKVKPDWICVPMGKSSVMIVVWLVSRVDLAIVHISQGAFNCGDFSHNID